MRVRLAQRAAESYVFQSRSLCTVQPRITPQTRDEITLYIIRYHTSKAAHANTIERRDDLTFLEDPRLSIEVSCFPTVSLTLSSFTWMCCRCLASITLILTFSGKSARARARAGAYHAPRILSIHLFHCTQGITDDPSIFRLSHPLSGAQRERAGRYHLFVRSVRCVITQIAGPDYPRRRRYAPGYRKRMNDCREGKKIYTYTSYEVAVRRRMAYYFATPLPPLSTYSRRIIQRNFRYSKLINFHDIERNLRYGARDDPRRSNLTLF